LKNFLVIGAGIHGTFIAKYLKNFAAKITIIEKNPFILDETSKATHNRANRGYHYPRSKKTFDECNEAYEYFSNNYNKYLKKNLSFYCIENKSKTSFNKYLNFFKKNKLRCKIIKKNKFIKNENLEGIIKSDEGCFDHFGITKMMESELKNKNIKLIKNFDLKKVKKIGKFLKLISTNNKFLIDTYDIIINATYDKSNEVLKKFNIESSLSYFYQYTEIAVVYCKRKIPGITIMDGDFITIMPYISKKNLYLIYDVKNSILKKGKIPFKKNILKKSNFKLMLKKISKYVNFSEQFIYKYSLYGHRPIPVGDCRADRSTKIKKFNYHGTKIYSIMEGKYISAPLVAKKLTNLICKQNQIKKLR
jgi:hypothetical protein